MLKYLLHSLNSEPNIKPKIILTSQAKLASLTLIYMLNSLSVNSTLYTFIIENFKLPIEVIAKEKKGELAGAGKLE